MDGSRKQRKNDQKVAAHFRADCIHAFNGEWYFLTREGQNIGPFPTRKETEPVLEAFLKTVRKEE